MGPGINPMGGGYLNSFNPNTWQLQSEVTQLQEQLMMVEEQIMQSQQTADRFGGNFPVGGMAPMGGINPLSQIGGIQPPNQIMQAGGVTQGLKDVSGTGTPPFPKGTQETSGGYLIVPKAAEQAGQDAASQQGFTVYKPGSKGATNDNILFENWGDPHVADKSGNTVFSYSKDCDFQLPDGTTIGTKTSAWGGGGATLVAGIDIQNGNSHVNMNYNSATNNYDISPDTNDGLQWLANRMSATNWSKDTYNVAVDSTGNPSFYDFFNGQDLGKVTGAIYQDGSGYTPTVDHNQTNYAVAKEFAPQPGSPNYGNTLFEQAFEQVLSDPKYQGKIPADLISKIESKWYADVAQTQEGLTGLNSQPPPPVYPGYQFGGATNMAQMQWLSSMYTTLGNFPTFRGPGAFGGGFAG